MLGGNKVEERSDSESNRKEDKNGRMGGERYVAVDMLEKLLRGRIEMKKIGRLKLPTLPYIYLPFLRSPHMTNYKLPSKTSLRPPLRPPLLTFP